MGELNIGEMIILEEMYIISRRYNLDYSACPSFHDSVKTDDQDLFFNNMAFWPKWLTR